MILIDEMKNMKIYRQKTFLPTKKGNKKSGSAILLLTPNYESSHKLMNHPLFMNIRRYMSYYLERDVSFYIGSKEVEELEEGVLLNSYEELDNFVLETKRSELPDSAFGVPSKRKFPLDTEAHVRSAIKFFNYVDPEDEAELARRIKAAMKKFGINDVNVSEKNRFSKYYHPKKKSTNESVEESFDPNIDTIVFDIGDVLLKHDGQDAELMDYTRAVINSLKEKGYKLYYLSNWNKTNYEYNWHRGSFEFLDKFDGGVFDWEIDISKPDLDIYKELINRYNLDPSKCIFYDDKYENIEAAQNLGFNGIVFDKVKGLENIIMLPNLNDYTYEEDTMNTDKFISAIPESAFIMDNTVLFFNEDANDANLRKLLFKSRIRQRKELLELLDKVKADNSFIKFAFPELKRLAGKNVFVDLYYYNNIFFNNNIFKLRKGLALYSTFVDRLLNHPNLKQNGYDYKTIFIPVEDWDFGHDGNIWNYRMHLNPISVIYQLMFEANINTLKKTFGDTNVVFVGNNSYFKINFNQIDMKEIKKYALKLRIFTQKITKREEFDTEDIDTSSDNSDSTEVIKAKIVDKIEISKGVDLTAKVDTVSKEKEKIDKLVIKAYSQKKQSDFNKAYNKAVDATEDSTKTSQSVENKKRLLNKKDKQAKEIDNSTKSKLSKSEEKDDIDINANNTNEEDLERLASAIVRAANNNDNEEDAMDELDIDEIKRVLVSIASDNEVDISPTRAARMNKLNQELLDKQVNGRSVKEILANEDNKKEIVTKVNIASPNEEWDELKFVNFDKYYDIEKDIVAIFHHFADCSRPIAIKDLTVTDVSTSEDRLALYEVKMEDYRGARFTVKLDIPIMEDNRFLLRGNYKSIQTQFFNMPIIKTETDTCQLISNYNKIFLYRFGTTTGKSSPIVSRIIKAANKYNGRKIKFTTGYNLKVSNKYQLPIDYVDLSKVFTYIETEDLIIYFNQDEIRSKYVIENGKGIPYAFNKKENVIEYFKMDSFGYSSQFDRHLYLILKQACPTFGEIFDSTTRPSSCMFTRASIMSSKIPLVVILGYYIGLRPLLERAKIPYTIEKKLTQEIRKNIDVDWIKFNDGYVVYDVSYSANLLLNGLKECSTDIFSLSEIDSKNMYLEFLDNYGGRIKSDGLDNFRDLFVDPMIKESLEFYKLPTDFVDILLYGNSLMADNKYIKHTDTSSRKLRRYQLISVYAYKALSNAYAIYSNMLKHNSNNASFDVKRSAVVDMFLTDNITSDDSIINALRDVETTNAITTKGPSGMNADRAYSLDKRAYDESMINVLGMSTGFAGNVGITRQTTIDANVTSDGYVKSNNGDTSTMNDVNTLTATESIVPMTSTHDDPMRTAMSFIQTSKHSVRTEESDPLLVTNGADEAMAYITTNRFVYKAKMEGKILEINERYILIEYNNGSKDIVNLEETIEKNSDGGYFVPLKLDAVSGLKAGMKITENQILAYDHYSFSNSLGESDNIAYNVGKIAKVAILNSDECFEDSGIISTSLANKLATRIDIQYACVVNKDSTIFKMAKVGDHIEASDNLIVWEDTFDDEDAADIMSSLAVSNDFSELGKKKLKSEVTGTLKGIKIYRTVEIDEMSPTVKKVVTEYEKPIKEMANIIKANNISMSKVPAHYVLPPTGKLKKSQDAIYIEFYVEYLDTVGVGDKVVYKATNKAVEKSMFPEGHEPYTAFRLDEKIDCFVGITSINKRLVTSTVTYGSLQKLCIELDRAVKDIMGIPQDKSKI